MNSSILSIFVFLHAMLSLACMPQLFSQAIDTSQFSVWREQVSHFIACNEYDSVLIRAEQARQYAEEHRLNELQLEFTCKQTLAHFRVYPGRSERLLALFQHALPLADRMAKKGIHSYWLPNFYSKMAEVLAFRHQFEQEKTYLYKALISFPPSEELYPGLRCGVLMNLALHFIYHSELDSASIFLELAGEFTEEESRELFFWYGTKARLEFQRQNYLEAEDLYLKQLALVSILGEFEYRDFMLYHFLANVYLNMGDLDLALQHIELARGGPRKYLFLGQVHLYAEDFPAALFYLHEAKAVILQNGGYVLNYLPSVYQLLGETFTNMQVADSAEIYYLKIQDVKQTFSDQDSFLLHTNLGFLYLETNNYQQSLEYFLSSKAFVQETLIGMRLKYAHAWLGTVEAYLGLDSTEQALTFVHKTLATLKPGHAFDPDLSSFSIQHFANPQIYFSCIEAKGNIYLNMYKQTLDQQMLDSALYFYELADRVLDTLQIRFRGDLTKKAMNEQAFRTLIHAVETCDLLFQHTGEHHFLEQAFYFAERSKSIRLFEAIRESEARQLLDVPDSLLRKERKLLNEIQYHEQQLQIFQDQIQDNVRKGISYRLSLKCEEKGRTILAYKQAYRDLLDHFEQEYPTYFQQKYNFEMTSLSDVQRHLAQSGNALLEYMIGDSLLYLFVISADTAVLIKQALETDLISDVQQFNNSLFSYWLSDQRSDSIYTENSSTYASLAHQLYRQVLASAYPILRGAHALYIIPDGYLSYLPFELLLTEPVNKPEQFANHPYLIKQFPIGYGFSATTLFRTPISSAKTSGFLAIRPEFGKNQEEFSSIESRRRDGFGPLRYSKLETEYLEKAFGATVLEDSMATKKQVLHALNTQAYAMIHFATHAKSHDIYPKKAKIALTAILDSIEINDFLSFQEIFNLRLEAEMVVLSACETGLGEYRHGEGVMSLARAFAYAGAKSVLTTLWSVDDKSTAQLMQDFYSQLEQGASKAKALQQAKLSFLQQHDHRFAHPFFWAGPVVIGDNSPITLHSPDPLLGGHLVLVSICFLALLLFLARKRLFSGGFDS
ncbi:MAG: CHAT domain-containing tetratricopeptide repeat protein [Bacteroidota bacterium]